MAQILFASIPFAGHTNQLIVLAEEMFKRGHSVSFATGKAFKDRISKLGINFIEWDQESIIESEDLLNQYRNVWNLASKERKILAGEKLIHSVLIETYSAMFAALKQKFQALSPNLVVSDSAAIPAMDLAVQAKIPSIILAQFLGNHAPTAAHLPRYGTPYQRKMNFLERVLNRAHPLKLLYYLYGPFTRLEKYRKQSGLDFNLGELFGRSLMLVSTAFGVEIPRALPSNIFMVGPILPRIKDPLPAHLKEWLENSAQERNVVYMSFGTLATLDSKQAKTLVDGLSNGKFRVLWSLRKEQHSILPELPINFHVEEFVPQQAVLSHPAVKAFVSHCGMNSVSESLYFEKPILALPIFGDQHYNAARIVDLGVGFKLDKDSFTSEEVHSKIEFILKEKAIQNAVKWMSKVQQVQKGLDRSADILEATLAADNKHLLTVS